jgi:hypothetical protein
MLMHAQAESASVRTPSSPVREREREKERGRERKKEGEREREIVNEFILLLLTIATLQINFFQI